MTKRPKLDDGTAERLLSGELSADDAPPELARVASLFAAAASVAGSSSADPSFIAALAAEVDATPTTTTAPRRNPVLAKVLSVKAGVLAGVLVLGATGAAAATNALPDAAQHGVATAAKHVGLNLPDTANQHATDATTKHDSSSGDNTDEPTSTTEVHGKPDDNHGAAVSDVAHNHDATGEDHGAAVCAVASDNKCTAHRGEDNQGNENEDEHTTTTGVTVPDQANEHGADHAGGDDHGGSTANADTGSSNSSGHGSGSDGGGSGHSGRD